MNIFKQITATLSIFIAAALLLVSCDKKGNEGGPTFTVKGCIENADGKEIGIYSIGIEGVKQLSKTRLNKDGNYEFRVAKPECFDFYMLVIDSCGRTVFLVDSTETVTINANASALVESYTIDGNPENLKIKEIDILLNTLNNKVYELANSTSPAVVKTRKDINALVKEFKETIVKEYIIPNPGCASAYYALSLRLAGAPIFNPTNDRNDTRYFAAVATNFGHAHPDTKHTRYITDIAKRCIEATRKPQSVELDIEEADTTIDGLFEIKLPNEKGDSVTLSSLKGNVILLDFTAYESTEMSSRNIAMRKTYEKYKKQGFEIYQVSLDRREHFWQQSAANLPWTCVRDVNGTAARLYAVEKLPTYFLINRNGEIVLRDLLIKNPDEEIEKLLKEK